MSETDFGGKLEDDQEQTAGEGMRCPYCKASNAPGETWCRVCGAWLQGQECPQCHHHNPPGYNFCGLCGRPLGPGLAPPDEAEDASDQVVVVTSRGVTPVLIIGFGAVLALASVAFPWYVLSQSEGQDYPTLFQQLAEGWELFPGVPLVLIGVASIVSALLGIMAGRGKPRPVASVVTGIIGLISVAWLWQGLQAQVVGRAVGAVPVETGPMLAAIGAIIIVVGGALIARIALLR